MGVGINYIIAFIALVVLSSVAISKYNSQGFGDLLSNNLLATLRDLVYSGLVFSLIAWGMTGYLYSQMKIVDNRTFFLLIMYSFI